MINFIFIIGISIIVVFVIVPFLSKLTNFFFNKEFKVSLRLKWILVGICIIALLFIDLDYKKTLAENTPLKIFFKKGKPSVSCEIKPRDVSKYAQGELINGILWDTAYEKYELIIENKSGYPLYDFNCILTVPGFILQKDIIETKSDNPEQIVIKDYDYELEMLEQQKDGRFVHSENVVANRFDIYIEEFNKKHKTGIWFYVKPMTFDGKIIVNYYIDSERETGYQSAFIIKRKDLDNTMILSNTLTDNFGVSSKVISLDTVTLNQDNPSKTFYLPEY